MATRASVTGLVIALILLVVAAPASAARVYKWTDADGTIHFSDKKAGRSQKSVGKAKDDSGTADSGTADSGTADSGTADSGTADSGTADSGTADSGTADSGTADSGTADSGTADSGTADSGTADSGTADSGTADSGTADFGTADDDAVQVIDVSTGGGSSSSGDSASSFATGHALDCRDHPDAFKCYKFIDDASVKQLWVDPGLDCIPDAIYSTEEAAGQLTVGSLCPANSAGSFRFSFPMQEDELWMQFRFKQEQAFIDEPRTFKLPSAKIFVLWSSGPSCTEHQFVQTNAYWRGYPQFYENCGADPLTQKLPDYDYDLQPGGDTRCHYKSPTERLGEKCLFYRAEWGTYTYNLDLDGSEHGGVPWVDGWVQYDDESQRYHILSFALQRTRMLGEVYFSPYMTGKSTSIDHPQWKVWFQDFLITSTPLVAN